MNNKELLDEYWRIFQNVNEWIKFSDQKAGVILTVYGIIFTIVYTNYAGVATAIHSSCLQYIGAGLSTLFALGSIVCSFLCLNPNLTNNNYGKVIRAFNFLRRSKKSNKGSANSLSPSIIYYGHIATQNNEWKDYFVCSKTIIQDVEKYVSQIAEQIHTNSVTAQKKFRYVSWAVKLFFASLYVIICSTLLYVL